MASSARQAVQQLTRSAALRIARPQWVSTASPICSRPFSSASSNLESKTTPSSSLPSTGKVAAAAAEEPELRLDDLAAGPSDVAPESASASATSSGTATASSSSSSSASSSTPVSSLPNASSKQRSPAYIAYPDLLASDASFGNLVLPSSSLIPRTNLRPSFPGQPLPPLDAPQHKHINFPERLFETIDDVETSGLIPELLNANGDAAKLNVLEAMTGMKGEEIRGLNRYTVVLKRVVNMTKKGKMPSFFAMLVVGSPSRGFVGVGQGRGDTAPSAIDGGFQRAVLNMDYVNKYESRTLWGAGQELSSKWGSTTVIMRGRPAGFGLAVPGPLHRLFTACGIRDASATIEGSRNPMQVLKAGIQILHGGYGPPGLGSGIGTKGSRSNKGVGMRGRDEVERERGRWGIEVGRRL